MTNDHTILSGLIRTRQVRQLLARAVPELLDIWAGDSRWKRKISRAAGHVVGKPLSHPDDGHAKNDIRRLLEDDRFMGAVMDRLTELIQRFGEALDGVGDTVQGLSVEEQKRRLVQLLAATGRGRTGALLTGCARVLNEIHRSDPEFLAHHCEAGFERWVEAMDFGEFKQALENSAGDLRALVEMANDVIWRYPAKVVLLLSLAPTIVNTVAAAVGISVRKLNGVPPDVLADIGLAFVREVDGRAVARLVDELAEAVRKFHTGSALIGDPGSSPLANVFADGLRRIVADTDAATFWKARMALAEIKAAFHEQLHEALMEKPDYDRLGLMRGPELFNLRMRTRNHRQSRWMSMEDEDAAQSMMRHLAAYDTEEAAEVFNHALRMINRLIRHEPDTCGQWVRQFVDAVDAEEITAVARHVMENADGKLRPVGRAVVPALVQWVCQTLEPREDEHEPDAARARSALRALLMTEEV